MCQTQNRWLAKDNARRFAYKLMYHKSPNQYKSAYQSNIYKIGKVYKAKRTTSKYHFEICDEIHGGAFHVFPNLKSLDYYDCGQFQIVKVEVDGYIASGSINDDEDSACYQYMRIIGPVKDG